MLEQCSGRRLADGGWEERLGRARRARAARGRRDLALGDRDDDRRADYSLFAHLETVYLGCLARRTLIMRNVAEVVEAAHGKPILFFPARHDHWLVQTGDGWAAHVAGAIGVSTDAQASWWGGRGVGTVPHGLIAAYGGDTVLAARDVRRPLRARHERHGAGRLRQRLRGHGARGGARARRRTCGACGSTRRTGSPTSRSSARTASRAEGRRARARRARAIRARRERLRGRQDRRLGRIRRRAHPRASRRPACRSTPTASARR